MLRLCFVLLVAASGLVRFDGTLASGDRELNSGEYYDVYDIEVEEGARLTVTMRSRDFDTYLIVKRPDREQEDDDDASDDREDGYRRSRVVLTAPVSGTYRILATSYEVGETGHYTVIATTRDP